MATMRYKGYEAAVQFVVRAEPSLHKAMSSAAKRAGMSLNKWVTATLERAVSGGGA